MLKLRELLTREIHQSYFVVVFCVGVIAGIIMGLVLRINYFASPVWVLFVVLIMVFSYLKPKYLLMGVCLIAGMVLAFYRVTSELAGEEHIRQFYGQTVVVTGTVNGDPETGEKGTKIRITDLKFGEEELYAAKGSIFVTLRTNEDVRRSDILMIEGKIENGFGTFAGYMYQPKILKIMKPEPGDLTLKTRDFFAERIKRMIPEPQVDLGLSYLLGMKTGLPDDLELNLRMVGLVHLVVASGTHLSILVDIAKKMFGKMSRFAGLLFSGLFVLFFMAMVGFTPSILRAGIMSIMTLVAWYAGRRFAPWRIILLVAAATLIAEPTFIINLGWLLSFASFSGIMLVGPWLLKFFYGEKKPGFIASLVITTLSATMMTLPITLYYYGTVSLISMIANLLILPTLPYVMGLVFATGVVSGVPFVGDAISFVATRLLDYHILIINMFGGMRSFVIEIEPYQGWVFGIYGLIGLGILIGLLRRKMVKLREVRNNKLE